MNDVRVKSRPEIGTLDTTKWPHGGYGPSEGNSLLPPHAAPRIDIRVDGALTTGLMRNRRDLIVSGLVLADHPIEAISLVAGGQTKALSLYGRDARIDQAFTLTTAQLKDAT